MDRYQVNTSRGEPGIRTNSLTYAEKVAAAWGVEVITHVQTEGAGS